MTMDEELDRLRKLIDEFDSILALRKKIDHLETEIVLRDSKIIELKNHGKNLMQLIEMQEFTKRYYEFSGTIKDIEKRGNQIVIVLWDGPKKVRFVLGDNRWPNLREGQNVTIQADITPITIPWPHAPGGFVQGSSVRDIEIKI